MKKLLIATTALVATAGVAAAEVETSGDGRMGIVYDGTDARFSSRLRIKFTATGETDGGLSFGGSVRSEQNSNGNNLFMTAGSVYISGAFGKLSMGDNDTAANAAVGHVSGVGYTGIGNFNETGGFLGQPDTSVLYTYTTNGLTFYASAGQQNLVGNESVSVAVKYESGNFLVALGYEDVIQGGIARDMLSLKAQASFGDATVKAVLKDDSNFSDVSYALSVDYVTGATTITAFYADTGTGAPTGATGFGLGAAYDLGGGAAVKGGIVAVDGLDTAADLGITFSF